MRKFQTNGCLVINALSSILRTEFNERKKRKKEEELRHQDTEKLSHRKRKMEKRYTLLKQVALEFESHELTSKYIINFCSMFISFDASVWILLLDVCGGAWWWQMKSNGEMNVNEYSAYMLMGPHVKLISAHLITCGAFRRNKKNRKFRQNVW